MWIESPGTVSHTSLMCVDELTEDTTHLQLSMSVELAEGKVRRKREKNHLSYLLFFLKFFRTRVVTFSPRFMLVNALPYRLYYKQKSALTPAHLDKNEKMPLHWQDRSEQERELSIGLSPDGHFSGKISNIF